MQEELFKEITKENYLSELDNIFNGTQNGQKNEVVMKFEDFHKLYQEKSVDLGNSSNLDKKLASDFRAYKMDAVTKILMIASFALTFAVTLLTFIWGIL